MEATGVIAYVALLLTLAGIYGVLTLGLNLQWGFTGLFNIGIAAFFAVGAYTSGILTTPPSPDHLGGFDLPVPIGMAGAMAISGALGLGVGAITIRLRTDYLAIATLGIAEIVRLVLKNEEWLTGGVRGLASIPRPFESLGGGWSGLAFLAIVLAAMAIVYLFLERAIRSPWGRLLHALRDNELSTRAAGKNIDRLRRQSFMIGSAIMGLGGALYAHFFSFISPEAFDPAFASFLVWIMLVAGGSGNNRGALLGAFAIWGLWAGTEFLVSALPAEIITQAGAIRVLLIGLLLQVILILRPQGLLPERQDSTHQDPRHNTQP
ncbi:MAG: branched-chain amino acid ABC transporter permease [Alphaproteobacteria bacterium]